jgi:hypothetical protein
MCWKYEGEYKKCFDHMFFEEKDFDITGEYAPSNLIDLLKEYGVEITDVDIFKEEFFLLLDKCHILRIIHPIKETKTDG